MPLGLYIHIPFCRKKCIYCDFTVIDTNNKLNLDIFKDYIELLKREIDLYLREKPSVNTIYIGGGTPSIIGEKLLKNLVNHLSKYINIEKLSEFTIEANPEDITPLLSKTIKETGITRVSLGIQSMNNQNLKTLSRQNTPQTNERAIKTLQDSGIQNINCDIIFDIPNSTDEEPIKSINEILKFNIPHISAYGLTIEEYTPLNLFVKKGLIKPKNNFKEEFITIHQTLEKEGFNHYEVSNYAKKGYESVHNLLYWNREEYIGIGISACGFINNKRYQNEINLKKYNEKLQKGELPIMFEETIDRVKEFEEIIMLGLRKKEGIKLEKLKVILPEKEFQKLIDKTKNFKNYLKINDNSIRPTLEGWILLDYITTELISSINLL